MGTLLLLSAMGLFVYPVITDWLVALVVVVVVDAVDVIDVVVGFEICFELTLMRIIYSTNN